MSHSSKLLELKRAGVVARVKSIMFVGKHSKLTALFASDAFKSLMVSKLMLYLLPTSSSLTFYFIDAQMQAEKKQQLVFIGSQMVLIDASLDSCPVIIFHTRIAMKEEWHK
jgi:hypothetical protein